MNIAVLGGGLVGTPMALDLHQNKNLIVKLADINPDNLTRAKEAGVECLLIDLLKNDNLEKFISSADFVLNALPGEIGYQSLKRAIKAGKSGVDIAFYPEDFSELETIALEKGLTWVVDMGVAPGMSHLLSAHAVNQLDETKDIKIYVGGLPKNKDTFWQYKAPFSPSDVLEEYTRPARFVRDGKIIEMPALTEKEILNFPTVGELEAFNSDGLRSLIKNLPVPNMIEKTLRFPGYTDKIEVLKNSGFFSTEKITVGDQQIKPLDLTSKVLFEKWKLDVDEVDFTIMQIRVKGTQNGEEKTIIYDLYDEYCPKTQIHSMARTTGYAATSVLGLMIDGFFTESGVFPPEKLGSDPFTVNEVLRRLSIRGIEYNERRG